MLPSGLGAAAHCSTHQEHTGATQEPTSCGFLVLYTCQGSDFGREVLNQVGQLQEQCTRLQEAAEQLWGDSKDTQVSVVTSSAQEPLVL